MPQTHQAVFIETHRPLPRRLFLEIANQIKVGEISHYYWDLLIDLTLSDLELLSKQTRAFEMYDREGGDWFSRYALPQSDPREEAKVHIERIDRLLDGKDVIRLIIGGDSGLEVLPNLSGLPSDAPVHERNKFIDDVVSMLSDYDDGPVGLFDKKNVFRPEQVLDKSFFKNCPFFDKIMSNLFDKLSYDYNEEILYDLFWKVSFNLIVDDTTEEEIRGLSYNQDPCERIFDVGGRVENGVFVYPYTLEDNDDFSASVYDPRKSDSIKKIKAIGINIADYMGFSQLDIIDSMNDDGVPSPLYKFMFVDNVCRVEFTEVSIDELDISELRRR